MSFVFHISINIFYFLKYLLLKTMCLLNSILMFSWLMKLPRRKLCYSVEQKEVYIQFNSILLTVLPVKLRQVKVSSSYWHQCFGHPTLKIIKSILSSNKLDCSFNNKSYVCDACQCAKSHQLPYNSSVRVASSPLKLIHIDVCEPDQVSSGGFRYYVSFLDDYICYTWIYLIKHKYDVE